MIAAGLVRLGRYIRFVSYSVMFGFLTGIAVNMVLGQLPDLARRRRPTGLAVAEGVGRRHPPAARSTSPSLLAGLAALAILVLLGRTRIAVVQRAGGAARPDRRDRPAGADTVVRVKDSGAIPPGCRCPRCRTSACCRGRGHRCGAVAAIVLVQGAGVAEAAPNPDGSRSNPTGLHRPGRRQPGRRGSSAASRWAARSARPRSTSAAGARSPMGGDLLRHLDDGHPAAFSGLVGEVAMPTLAAVLVYAAVGTIAPDRDPVGAAHRADPGSRSARLRRDAAPARRPGRRRRRGGLAAAAAQPGGARPAGGRLQRTRRRPARGGAGTAHASARARWSCSTSTDRCSSPAPAPSSACCPTVVPGATASGPARSSYCGCAGGPRWARPSSRSSATTRTHWHA